MNKRLHETVYFLAWAVKMLLTVGAHFHRFTLQMHRKICRTTSKLIYFARNSIDPPPFWMPASWERSGGAICQAHITLSYTRKCNTRRLIARLIFHVKICTDILGYKYIYGKVEQFTFYVKWHGEFRVTKCKGTGFEKWYRTWILGKSYKIKRRRSTSEDVHLWLYTLMKRLDHNKMHKRMHHVYTFFLIL